MHKLIILFGIVLTFSPYLLETRSVEHAPLEDCYGTKCPEGTVLCKKVTNSTDSILNIDVKCLDENGKVLRVNHTEKKNPFPDLEIHSISIHGIFKLPGLIGDGSDEITQAPDSEAIPRNDEKDREELLD